MRMALLGAGGALAALTACAGAPPAAHRTGAVSPVFYDQVVDQCVHQPTLSWCIEACSSHPWLAWCAR